MPNVNDLKTSKFLKKEDVDPPVLVTIKSYDEMNVAMENQAPEMKWCLNFHELEKPLVLNQTNGQLISVVTGSGEFEDWLDKKIVLYDDKTVMFAGKVTGGIRVRAARNQPSAPPIQEPEDTTDYGVSDSIPF